jgi:hypothetical protein
MQRFGPHRQFRYMRTRLPKRRARFVAHSTIKPHNRATPQHMTRGAAACPAQ